MASIPHSLSASCEPLPILTARPADAASPENLRLAIETASRAIPSQGPIGVFVFENPLLALEHLQFHEALAESERFFGCDSYFPESRYRAEIAKGRIRLEKLRYILTDELGDRAQELVGGLTTRLDLRLAMLQYPLMTGSKSELAWHMAENRVLKHPGTDASAAFRTQLTAETRHWMLRDLRGSAAPLWAKELLQRHESHRWGGSHPEQWNLARWETVAIEVLWKVCLEGVGPLPSFEKPSPLPIRHRDLLLRAGGPDCDLIVNEILIRFTSAFLDQGLSRWPLPSRERGFLRSFLDLYAQHAGPVAIAGLTEAARELSVREAGALDLIQESLAALAVPPEEQGDYLTATLLSLRGWAGMVHYLETKAGRVSCPVPPGSFEEFLAVRLLLDRLALQSALPDVPIDRAAQVLRKRLPAALPQDTESRAYIVFQLAQILGWIPSRLFKLKPAEWEQLVREIETFTSHDRRRVFQKAYEGRLLRQSLDALNLHRTPLLDHLGPETGPPTTRPAKPMFQSVFCIDAREESFRRHLEESCPEAETFGAAGFFGVPMHYRGATSAHFAALCPIVVTPRNWVTEIPVAHGRKTHHQRARLRRSWGRLSRSLHLSSRHLLPGAMYATFLGGLAAIPMVARVLFPRLTGSLTRTAARATQAPATQLELLREEHQPAGPEHQHLGFTLDEMTDIAERSLRDIGIVGRLSDLVIFLGHGSECQNNPHESAYHCGACSGGQGGPNARALALMLNNPLVRQRLAARNLDIPATTWFVGGQHNTATDEISLFDEEQIPPTHHESFRNAVHSLEVASGRNAQERCRRFYSAALSLSPNQALRHVQGRATDMAQTRPEYGNATNCMCVVGRRIRTRGLFLDRRSFLQSYDPWTDPDGKILARILSAVVLVCKGINLQYYFSAVDPGGWGAGTKLPHNVVSLIGVMDGATSDLRIGLPWQGVEVHEPVRLTMIVETTPEIMTGIIANFRAVGRLFDNGWVQLAILDPSSSRILTYKEGKFSPYEPLQESLPSARTSADWYRGWREHLEFATIEGPGT